MMNFKDQVVLITGASGGLGKEAAKQFAQQGAKLALCDINISALNDLSTELAEQGIEVFSQPCDVSKEQEVQSFIDNTAAHFGHIDVAINNAGIDPKHSPLADMDTRDFERVMDINVKGVYLCMKYQIPHMIKQGGGAICNMSSVAGISGAPFMSAYAASKHAVIGLSKSAAHEYGRAGIRVNSVCPYITMTDMVEQHLKTLDNPEEVLAKYGKASALRRVAQPNEVAKVMLFACDKNNSYMTGQELVVDGGMTAV
ncbi:MAG: SDR family NAD(P)-dependent oxidoreductase [Marinomonas sp.]